MFQRKDYSLEATVFLSGFIILTYEVVGARILGPYYGTSTFVWTAMIGIILASLSIGYSYGGYLADMKNAHKDILARILILAAMAIVLTYIIREPLLELLQREISGIRSGSIVAATILFLPASFLLGMVSPYAVKLRIDSLMHSGSTIGNMSALGTIGSILGTFLTGFYLIPHFGITTILIILPILLLLLALSLSPKRYRVVVGALLLMFCLLSFWIESTHAEKNLYEGDTTYSHIRVYDTIRAGERIRTLGINIENHSSMSLDSDRLVNEYTKYYHLIQYFVPDFQSVLMLGGAGYSFPKDFLKKYPTQTIDVVEIDPGVTEVAKKYFSLQDDPRLRIFHEDGRVYLNKNTKKYDAILGDAYTSWYSVPYQLTTREAIERQYESLTESGVVILNIISSVQGDTGEFLRAEYRTYRSIFPHVRIFLVNHPGDGNIAQNIILIAEKGKEEMSLTGASDELAPYLDHVWTETIEDDMPILTDDYAPVDHYIGKLLKNF